MSGVPICERLRAIESASPDFLGVNDGGCHTCFHRNPDGPEAADTIEALVEALESLCGSIEQEEALNGSISGVLMSDMRIGLAALSRARNGGQP